MRTVVAFLDETVVVVFVVVVVVFVVVFVVGVVALEMHERPFVDTV